LILSRREFVQILSVAAAANLITPRASHAEDERFYDFDAFGDVRLLHFTDCHAQLKPIYFREPNVNLGVGGQFNQPPHVVGEYLLSRFDIPAASPLAHAFSYLDFTQAAEQFGKVGGFAHLRTLIDKLREDYGPQNTLLMDGGDTWQGSATALWTRGKDMVDVCNALGVDVMTGHWEFTYTHDEVLANIEALSAEFIAQNVRVSEEALFDDFPAFDPDSGHAFAPYTVKTLGSKRIAVLGQAFPYTPIANPSRFIPNWTFGIQESELQTLVESVRSKESPDALILLSHNGMDVDLKLAANVAGIDAIFGGHTHDGVPTAVPVSNAAGTTLVTNAGSNGKFLGVMDLKFGDDGISDYRYRLLPVFSNLLQADKEMAAKIDAVRAPYEDKLTENLATAQTLLYRRGNFNGTFDQVICDAQRQLGDAQIALSPGFRWGTSVLPGQAITMEHVLDQTAITYPETYVREMSGENLKLILEDVADNLFNPDPYYQQGGDMVRLGGMNYVCDPSQSIGNRISEMTLDDGAKVEADKTYKVAGWATVGSQSPGRPIWDVVADYLRDRKEIGLDKINTPKLKNVAGNEGVADYIADY
jgi:sulfur-oxidizing protein SoxB